MKSRPCSGTGSCSGALSSVVGTDGRRAGGTDTLVFCVHKCKLEIRRVIHVVENAPLVFRPEEQQAHSVPHLPPQVSFCFASTRRSPVIEYETSAPFDEEQIKRRRTFW